MIWCCISVLVLLAFLLHGNFNSTTQLHANLHLLQRICNRIVSLCSIGRMLVFTGLMLVASRKQLLTYSTCNQGKPLRTLQSRRCSVAWQAVHCGGGKPSRAMRANACPKLKPCEPCRITCVQASQSCLASFFSTWDMLVQDLDSSRWAMQLRVIAMAVAIAAGMC